jgi:hypothetical protein
MIPHNILIVLPGTGGTGGVVSRTLDGVGRGQVKSGRKIDGMNDLAILRMKSMSSASEFRRSTNLPSRML